MTTKRRKVEENRSFMEFTMDPRWFSSTVLDLATTIYEEKVFERMPILADALMDTGCDNEKILKHCRSNIIHCQTCPIILSILGKKHPKNIWTLVVNYAQSIKKMIEAGKYEEVQNDFQELYEERSQSFLESLAVGKGKKETEFSLFRTECQDCDQIVRQMKKQGKLPANLQELLAFGKARPQMPNHIHRVIGLGWQPPSFGKHRFFATIEGMYTSTSWTLRLKEDDSLFNYEHAFLMVNMVSR